MTIDIKGLSRSDFQTGQEVRSCPGCGDYTILAEVGRDNIHVHNSGDPNPSVAFALSRLAHGPYGPTPLGVFRNAPTPSYGRLLEHQIAQAQDQKGPGDLEKVIRSRGT